MDKMIYRDYFNCAVREFTADGVSVGRCWNYVGKEFICPIHGDVKNIQENYKLTGKLTDALKFVDLVMKLYKGDM